MQIYIEQAISEIAIAHARANSATISKMLHKRLTWHMRKERKVFIFSHPAKNQNCKSYSRIANPTGWLLTNLQMQMTFKIIEKFIIIIIIIIIMSILYFILFSKKKSKKKMNYPETAVIIEKDIDI